MTAAPYTDAQRASMTALYRGLIGANVGLSVVPKWVVKAYVVACATRQDPTDACARAHFGCGLDSLGEGGKACATEWSQALAARHTTLARSPIAA